MHLQENTLHDLDLVAQYSQHHVTYAPVKFVALVLGDMHFPENTSYLWVMITQNDTQYSLHHVAYPPATFEVAMLNALDGDAFTGKFIIRPLTLTFRKSRLPNMSPSTICIM